MQKLSIPLINHADIGSVIRAERLRKNLLLSDLADAIGVTPSYLSDLERGRRNWTSERLEKAKKALK